MAVRFYLDRSGSDGRATVRMAVISKYRQRWLNVPLRVEVKNWNKRRGRLRSGTEGADEVNQALNELQRRAEALLLQGATPTEVVDEIRKFLGYHKTNDSLLELFDEWIEVKAIRVRPSSLKAFRRVRQHLQDFLGSRNSLTQVDATFLERFQVHLVQDKKLTASTVNRYLGYLRNYLRWLHERELIQQLPSAKSLPEASHEIVFLDPEEICRFREVDLSDLPEGYEKARFIFLFACFTGLRISDISKGMHPQAWASINLEEGFWQIREQKTGAFHRWILAAPVLKMLKARKESGAATPIPRLSAQKANRYIKEIARRAEIDTSVLVGNGEFRPKWELLTMHAGRRTFITLVAHEAGATHLLGFTHADMRILRRYIGSHEKARRKAIENVFREFVAEE